MIKSNNLDRVELIRELNNAMKGPEVEEDSRQIYHASTNSIEVLSQMDVDDGKQEELPKHTEEEVLAMVRDQRRK